MIQPLAKSMLIVEDDEAFRTRLVRAMQSRGFEVQAAADGHQALALAQQDSPELALVDLRMPELSGLEVVRALHEIDPTTRIVMLTGYGSIATALQAVRNGAVHYLTKPADVDQILQAFEARTSDAPPPPSEENYEAPSLARVEWEHINRVLNDCGGNISQAARVLGLHRRSLQRKLTKYPPRR